MRKFKQQKTTYNFLEEDSQPIEPYVNKRKATARFTDSGEFKFRVKYNESSYVSKSPKKKGNKNYFAQSYADDSNVTE